MIKTVFDIEQDILDYFKKCNTKFIFDCEFEDLVSSVKLIQTKYDIPNNLICIRCSNLDEYEKVLYLTKQYGYNFTLDIRKLFYENEGRDFDGKK